MSYYKKHIFVCTNQKVEGKVCCKNSGNSEIFAHLKNLLHQRSLSGSGGIRVSQSGCLGRCGLGPCMVIYPEGVWYTCQSMQDVEDVVNKHLVLGIVVERLLIAS